MSPLRGWIPCCGSHVSKGARRGAPGPKLTGESEKSPISSVALNEHCSCSLNPINHRFRRSNKDSSRAEGRDRIAELRIMSARIDLFRLGRADYVLPTTLGRGVDEDSAMTVGETAEQRIADR